MIEVDRPFDEKTADVGNGSIVRGRFVWKQPFAAGTDGGGLRTSALDYLLDLSGRLRTTSHWG